MYGGGSRNSRKVIHIINMTVATCFGYILAIFKPIPDKFKSNYLKVTPLIKETVAIYPTGTHLSFEIDIIWFNLPDNDPAPLPKLLAAD